MENATKALLIAAAVLIAIVLIAIGVRLVSSTSGATNQAGAIANSMGTEINQQKNTLTGLFNKM